MTVDSGLDSKICYKLDCRGNFEALLVPAFARLVTGEFDRDDLSRGQLFCTGEDLPYPVQDFA